MRLPAWFVLACVSVGLAACKKDMPTSSAPSSGSYGSMDGGEDFRHLSISEDDMEPAPTIQSTSADEGFADVAREWRRDRRAERKARRADAKGVLAAPTEVAAESEPSPVASSDGSKPTDDRPPEGDEARHIIYTAGMRIAVFNLPDAIAAAETLPDRFGGYVQSMSETQVVLRVPSKSLRPAMNNLGSYGNVERRWLNSQDVTSEYTDLESRLKALEKTHAQLLDLLDKARTVDEALEVRQALDRVAAELEVLKGRLRQLDNLTTYSTLTLDFYERGPHTPTPSSNDPFPWVDQLGVETTEWR